MIGHNLGRGINERNFGEGGRGKGEAEAHVMPLSVLSADPSPLEYNYSRLDGIPPVETDLFREVGGNLWLLKWIKDSRGLLALRGRFDLLWIDKGGGGGRRIVLALSILF